jgi:hypothetical protein
MTAVNRLDLTTDHTGLLELSDHATMLAEVCTVRWAAAHKISTLQLASDVRCAAINACDALNTLEVILSRIAQTLWAEATR